MLTQKRLKELLHYDPETGVFTWRVSRGTAKAGTAAGHWTDEGYRRIKLNRQLYLAHRLAFFYMTGAWPHGELDHKNRNRADNRWTNLREASRSQNIANIGIPKTNTSGFKGVVWSGREQKWQARITHKKQRRHLGYFDTTEDAHTAYVAAARSLFGEFARAA